MNENDNDRALAHVMTIAQTMLQAEKERTPITAALILEKTRVAAAILAGSFPDGIDVEAAAAELVRRFSHWVGRDSSLQDSEGHVAWLNAQRKKDWRYWNRYRAYLERKLSVEVVGGLDESTDGILAKLEDPRRPGAWDRRGLVVGHVQSGKTASYSGLVCKAADAGYKIIIVLAGLHNNLRSQTQIRLEEGFLGFETSADRDKVRPIGVAEIDSDPRIRPNCATTRADDGDFKASAARHIGISPEERPWLFVVKKQKTVLTELLRWIRAHVTDATDAVTGRRVVSNLPLLVIDDEADHASVDTGEQHFDADGKPDEEHQPKVINGLIRRILHSFEKKAYVGYTATPFANIFIHRRGSTVHEGPDLFPQSFIINLAAPSNYVGPARIFGRCTEDGREGGLPLMREFRDNVNEDAPGGWMPPKHDKAHLPVFAGQETPPPSLKEAIRAFVLACAARSCRGQRSEHSSMLIHVTRLTEVQKRVVEQVRATVLRMRQQITRGIDDSGLLEQLRTQWERDFVPTSNAIAPLLGEGDGETRVPSWEEIRSVLADILSDIEVRMINGSAKDALDYEERRGTGLKVIAVGGEKLSRGLTLEGLCVSYFVRTTKMYDTLMQMGRWFGYRPGYVDLCRLYTTPELVEWFGHIADASEELRAEFEDMSERGATPMDYGLKVRSHPVMLVTSPLKMRTAKPLQLSFSGELLETVALHKDKAPLDTNLRATEELLAAMGKPSESPTILRRRESGDHKWVGALWNRVSADLVADFLDAYVTHPAARKVNSVLLAGFVRAMCRRGELTSWTVAMLGGGDGNPWTFESGVHIDGTLKRKAEVSKPDRYSIGRLLSPRDEAIDLDEKAWKAALDITCAAFEAAPARRNTGEPQVRPDIPSGRAVRRVRGLGSGAGIPGTPERGLLLLYPLDPGKSECKALEARKEPVIAFGISFPSSRLVDVTVKYQVDHYTWEDYGPSE
ncbi:Z1 domain-containing protein [Azohydromonas australica]|uniref:Z1 domain-containing protein n=1 Tax=Azohydromonas australica TaxID=364039 RepID=UPI000491CC3D|nr:Z1 domain-containing protein [Azohydromonas australica]